MNEKDIAYTIWLSLGANLGNRGETIREALRKIAAIPATCLWQVASFYETAPWGKLDQPGFINTVAAVKTKLPVLAFLHETQRIEWELGRVRHEHWGARTIDIDLLVAEGQQMDTEELCLPHPYLTERAFVLYPLRDIAGGLVVKGKSVTAWCEESAIKAQEITLAAELNHPWPLKLIAAMDENRGLGCAGRLLAHIPADLARFKALTTGNVVIMGRKTAESLPGGAPLAGRINILLSRSRKNLPGFIVCHELADLWAVLGELSLKDPAKEFWCIGGGDVYRQLLPYVQQAEITRLRGHYEADTWLPELSGFELAGEEEMEQGSFQHWLRIDRERNDDGNIS